MQKSSFKESEVEPFEFQNQTVYRDIMRLSGNVRVYYSAAKNDLSKNFLQDVFSILFFVSKEIACLSFVQDPAMKMSILMGSTHKVFDSFAAFDMCYESQWISAIQYFEAKQILEKTYWFLKKEQEMTLSKLKARISPDSENFNKQFQ